MTKIRMAVSAAIVAATGLVGSQAALAATNPNVGPSDLFVAVWNSTTNTSYVEDLGTPWITFQSGGAMQTAGDVEHWTLPSDLTTQLGGSPDNFSVFAAQGASAPNQFFFGINSGTPPGDLPALATPDVTNNIVPSIEAYITNFMSSTNQLTGSGVSYYASCQSPINPGCNGGSYNLFALNNLGSANPSGGSLNFAEYVAGSGARSQATGSYVGSGDNVGVFTLSGNVLTYTLAGSTTPLPAAGWLLISGLLGLGTVRRRRDASAVAAV